MEVFFKVILSRLSYTCTSLIGIKGFFMYKVNYKFLALREKFGKFYNNELRKKYQELEPIRQKYLKYFILGCSSFIFLAGLYVYFCMKGFISEKTYASEGMIKLYFVYFAIAYTVCFIPISKFKSETKFMVMDKILSFFGGFNYSQGYDFIKEKDIRDSELFGVFHEQEQDDAFKGTYNGTEIKVSEQKLKRVIHTRKGRRDKTIFKGIFIELHFDKTCGGNTIVCGESFRSFCRYNWLEIILGILTTFPLFMVIYFMKETHLTFNFYFMILVIVYMLVYFFIFCGLFKIIKRNRNKKVCLEDVVFSKKWKVYADDQVEARYVLTPALMERMLAVKKLFHGYRIDFSFWKNNLLIAVHTNKDMFETTSLFKSTLEYGKVQEVICQLYSVFSVINTLKLNKEN